MSQAPLKIRLKIERPDGSDVELGGVTYKFRPDPNFGGHHVCEVANLKHANRLLQIDGYCLAGADEDEDDLDPAADEQTDIASDVQTFDGKPLAGIDVSTLSNKDVARMAKEIIPPEWRLNIKDRKSAAEIAEEKFGLTFQDNDSAIAITRAILAEIVKDEREEEDQAAKDQE